ncbi:MAG: peroxidase-related enzyme [Gammaproteobacteria bacterium]|nr:peroxidase-related enzyme [Gammaproteobacteria bacterium]
MPRFASLPEPTELLDVFRRFPRGVTQLLEYHDAMLRGPSPLSPGERELIAAYVSGLNKCHYCHDTHLEVAREFNIDTELAEQLLRDPDHAGIDHRLRPILDYVRKLTLTPARMVDADAHRVFDAGWDEAALHDAVIVCALFNFMNRVVEGMGVKPNPDMLIPREIALSDHTYTALKGLLDPG